MEVLEISIYIYGERSLTFKKKYKNNLIFCWSTLITTYILYTRLLCYTIEIKYIFFPNTVIDWEIKPKKKKKKT